MAWNALDSFAENYPPDFKEFSAFLSKIGAPPADVIIDECFKSDYTNLMNEYIPDRYKPDIQVLHFIGSDITARIFLPYYCNLWVDLMHIPRKADLDNRDIQFSSTYREHSMTSLRAFTNAIGLTVSFRMTGKRISEQELIVRYRELSAKCQNPNGVSFQTIQSAYGYPSSASYQARFGTIEALRKAAGYSVKENNKPPEKDYTNEELRKYARSYFENLNGAIPKKNHLRRYLLRCGGPSYRLLLDRLSCGSFEMLKNQYSEYCCFLNGFTHEELRSALIDAITSHALRDHYIQSQCDRYLKDHGFPGIKAMQAHFSIPYMNQMIWRKVVIPSANLETVQKFAHVFIESQSKHRSDYEIYEKPLNLDRFSYSDFQKIRERFFDFSDSESMKNKLLSHPTVCDFYAAIFRLALDSSKKTAL